MTEHIIEKLDRLATIQAYRNTLEVSKQGLVDAVLKPEIRAQLADIDLSFAPDFAEADDSIAALTEQIKAETLAEGKSVKGAHLHAIYAKGRVTWDGQGLEGYSVAHPEMAAFRKVGAPSVSFRKV